MLEDAKATHNDREGSEINLMFETRSPEIQEIIGKMPPWILRTGGCVIVLLVTGLFAGAIFIKYPDVVLTEVSIIATNPPVLIKSQNSSKIQRVMVSDGDKVYRNQDLVILENEMDIAQLKRLDSVLHHISGSIDLAGAISKYPLDENLQLGKLQPTYLDLLISIYNYKNSGRDGRPHNIDHLQKMQDNIKNMMDKIHHWEDKYLISSPIEGRITFLKPIEKHYPVKVDEDIFAVSPLKENSHIVTGQIKASSYTKVKVGQEIRISLDPFPSEEYGFLKGIVTKVSNMAVNNSYPIAIGLHDNLKTTSNRMIPMQHSLHGMGEIIINDQSILGKISSSLKLDALSNQ